MNAFDLRDPSSFPTRRVETWKYTDLRRHLRETPAPSVEIAVDGQGPFGALGSDQIAFGNGFAKGAEAFVASGDQTLRLRFVSEAVDTGHTATVRIVARPGAHLLLLESHEGAGGAYVAHNRIDIDVSAGAHVTRVVLIDEPSDAISVTDIDVRVEAGGVYHQTTLTTGAKLQRQATSLSHGGEGADVRIDGVYALSDARHTDLTSLVDHLGLNGVTSQLTKGVAKDTARGVFQGKILIQRGADGADARMGHHALILGERAEIDAKPELEIYADDVQCAHGNTVGNLDENALFYMEQRGIPADEARALLTQAFLIEVVDRIDHEGAREVVRTWLTERL